MSLTIHTKPGCKYCDLSKSFLQQKNIPFEIVNYDPLLSTYETDKMALMNKTNHYTFPQIFIDQNFIGGYTELMNAYDTCKLHELCHAIGITIEYDF